MRELMPEIFIQEVELDRKDPPSLNLIIIRGSERSLLFDAGVGENYSLRCRQELENMIEELGIDYSNLDCIISHAHADHVGLAGWLGKKGVRIYMNPEEKKHDRELAYFTAADRESRKKLFHTVGLKEGTEVYESMWRYAEDIFDGFDSCLNFDFLPVYPGEHISCGEYDFEVIPLKGHTFGQIGLYDENKNVIFCADHIMRDIVPIVGSTRGTDNYFQDYLDTMEVVKHKYRGALFIPCHGREFIDAGREADRIVLAYMDKCSDMLDLLRKENRPMTIREVGTSIYGRDADEPKEQQFPSCISIWSKTYACLLYLKDKGMVEETDEGGVPLFRNLV